MQVYSVSQKKIVDQPDTTTPTMQDGTSPVQAAPMPQQPVQPVQQPVAPVTPDPSQPSTITGHSIAEHAAALNAAKAAGDTAAIKQITDDYNREYAYQKDMALPAKAAADKITTAKANDYNLAKGHMQNLLDQFQGLSDLDKAPITGSIATVNPLSGAHNYKAQVKGMAASLAPLVGGGSGSGLKITQPEINSWAGLMPQAGQTVDNNQNNLISLDKNLHAKFGQGLDPEYLQQFGVTKDDKGVYKKSADSASVVERLGGGVAGDVGGIAKGVASLPGAVVQSELRNKGNQTQVMGDMATRMGKGMVDEYGNALGVKTANGQPILDPNKSVFQKGGVNPITGVDLGSAVNHAIDHPVNTALDLIPLTKGIGALKNASQAGEAANVVGKGMDVANATQQTAQAVNPVQKVIRNATDLVNGGGSQEYIARQAANPAKILPQNQVLMDEGILSHPTETGRIQATANAKKSVGTQLQDAYSNSDRVFKGNELSKMLDDQLGQTGTGKGYSTKDVNFIKAYINKQGNFDLNSGDNLHTMDSAWKIAQRLEQNPPKAPLGSGVDPKAVKQLALDTAGVIRQGLATKVPETLPLNAKYGALSDYYHNGLSDPEGLNLSGHGTGITGAVINGAKGAINPVLNGAYKAAGTPIVRTLIRDKRMSIDNPDIFRPKK